jgi:hypothetical protein
VLKTISHLGRRLVLYLISDRTVSRNYTSSTEMCKIIDSLWPWLDLGNHSASL